MEPRLIDYGAETKKLIITVACTGGMQGKEVNPNFPISPDEQAQTAYDCYNAGASILHLHVRDKDGQSTADLNVYSEAISKIRAKCPIIIQVGNGIGIRDFADRKNPYQFNMEERLTLVNIVPKPDMFTINAGTIDTWNIVYFENPIPFNEEFCRKAKEKGVVDIEAEIYNLGQLGNILHLRDHGFLSEPLHMNFVHGMAGGAMPPTPESLLSFVRAVPEGTCWQTMAIGRFQIPMITLAIAMGGGVRIGFEDNVYYGKGELAKSNAQMVERVVRLAKEVGREVATAEEARQILKLHS
jgi:3-keto-5-aminohexanoate cleavage enzyme